MLNHSRFFRLFVFASLSIVAASEARADLGNRLLRGLTYALSPSIGTLQNGPQADQNVFRQHIIRNYAGDGYGYEFTRTFGTDSFGNAQQLNAGPVNMSLQGTVHNRVEFSKRFIPEIQFQSDSGGAPITYDANIFTGGQNVGIQGQLISNANGTINALGFYHLEVAASNTGTRTADGLVLTDDQLTDFDVGPINVSGNIFLDGGAALLQAFGNQIGATEVVLPSAASGKSLNADTAAAGNAAAGIDEAAITKQLQDAVVQAMLSQMLEQSLAMMLDPNAMLSSVLGTEGDNASNSGMTLNTVPEPATIGLLAIPAAWIAFRRRRA